MLVTLEGEGAKDIARALAFHVPETKKVVEEEEDEEVGEVTTIDGPVVEPPPEQIEKEKPKKPPDWRNSVNSSHIKDEKLKKKIMDMLERHQSMWERDLGDIKATAHRGGSRKGGHVVFCKTGLGSEIGIPHVGSQRVLQMRMHASWQSLMHI